MNRLSTQDKVLTDQVISVRPKYQMAETNEQMLDGDWLIQTIGLPAELVTVRCFIRRSNFTALQSAAAYKKKVTVDMFEPITGMIQGQVEIADVVLREKEDPLYDVTLTMAVTPDV